MTIELPPELEIRLKGAAAREGVAAEELVRQLIVDRLPAIEGPVNLSDLFANWAAEDATNDPAEIAQRNQEVEELKAALNHNRMEMEGSGHMGQFVPAKSWAEI